MRDGLMRIALAAVVLLSAGAPSASAKELYKDEGGRLIYSIDDDGVVSMFESLPGIDTTLSVTRGTREQMRPVVSEVSPSSVPAGTAPLFKIRGKNLVGATVKFSRSGIELGPYGTKPTIIEIPLRVAPNVAVGEVHVEVTTPIGSATASFQVTEARLGGTTNATPGLGRPEKDKRQPIPTTAPATCPEGMIGVAAESGGFCIDLDQSFSGDIRKAEKTCAMAGKRLCQAHEWQHACEQARSGHVALRNIVGDWEWTGSYAKYDVQVQTTDLSDELKSVLLGQSDCQTPFLYPSWRAGPYSGRCCK